MFVTSVHRYGANHTTFCYIAPSYISDLFTERQTSISLRGKRTLVVPRVNTTNYGLHSFRYHASKLWNLLPDNVRVSTSLAAFKN